uniref:Uncharacterized protein n=1 Tax=Peronospora matthiolae TaxID=2874970 RepID=A0AAV1TA92_9STRA
MNLIQLYRGAIGREVVPANVNVRPGTRNLLWVRKFGHVKRKYRAKDAVVEEDRGESGSRSGMLLDAMEKPKKGAGRSGLQPMPKKKSVRSRNWRHVKKTCKLLRSAQMTKATKAGCSTFARDTTL